MGTKQVLNREGGGKGMLSSVSTPHYLSAQVSLVWAVEQSLGGAVFVARRERTRVQ